MHTRRGDPDGESRLVDALIARQDAQSQRTAGRITAILDTHVSARDVAVAWIAECARVHASVGSLADRWLTECRAAGLPAPSPAAVETVRELAADAIAGYAVSAEDRRRAAEPASTEARPTVTRSRTLAGARAQSAALMARLIDLKGRILKPGTWTLGGRRL